MTKRPGFILSILLFLCTVLPACYSPTPTQAPPTGTATLKPSPTQPEPSATPLPPTPTATLSPRPSSSPTATITPIPVPVQISAQNAARLRRQSQLPLLSRGQLESGRWSSDGKLILVSSSLGLSLLDAATLHKNFDFTGTYFRTLLTDGRAFVTRGNDMGYLDLQSGEFQPVKAPVQPQWGWWPSFAVSPDGAQLVYSTGGNTLTLLNLANGITQTVELQHERYSINYFYDLSFSADGKFLFASTDSFDNVSYVIDLATLKPKYELYRVWNPSFSSNGLYLLLSADEGLRVLLTRNGIPLNRFSSGFLVRPPGGGRLWYSAETWAFHPDGTHVGVIYKANFNGNLYLWSMATGQPETIVKDLPLGNRALAFSPDGKQFLTASSDGSVRVLNLEQGALLQTSEAYDQSEPAFDLESQTMAVARGGRLEVWDLVRGELVNRFGDYPSGIEITIEKLTPRHVLVTWFSNQDYKLRAELWNVQKGELVRTFLPYNSGCTLDPAATRLVCGSQQLQVFDAASGKLLYSRKSSDNAEQLWAISPDGKRLAVCTVVSESGTYRSISGDRIFLLDLSGKQAAPVGTLEGSPPGVCSPMAFSPDSIWLAAQNGAVWRLEHADQPLLFSPTTFRALAYSPDSSLLLAGNQLIDLSSGQTIVSLDVSEGSRAAFFDPGGLQLRVLTDSALEIWQVLGK